MRYSAQREEILNVLRKTVCHPDAEWVYAEVKKKFPDVSLGTVYRNLKELCERGELISLQVGDGCVHYDGRTSEHAHFRCRSCGKISDVFLADAAIGELEKTGYKVDGAMRVYYGVCPDCE